MRPFRSTRLLVIAALVLPCVLVGTVLPAPAWAAANKKANCYKLSGTWGGDWSLLCQQEQITGGRGTVSPGDFPGSSAQIVWLGGTDPAHKDKTTVNFTSIVPKLGRRDKCHTGSKEYVLKGSVPVNGNTASPGIIGHVHALVCVSAALTDNLSLLGTGTPRVKPFKI